MKHLAVINSATNEVKVFAGKKKLQEATFDRALLPEELEAMRQDPNGFLKAAMGESEPAPVDPEKVAEVVFSGIVNDLVSETVKISHK